VRIRFGHPMKKNNLGLSSPWEAAMAGLQVPWSAMGELTGEGR
jgi:hypothetical protein